MGNKIEFWSELKQQDIVFFGGSEADTKSTSPRLFPPELQRKTRALSGVPSLAWDPRTPSRTTNHDCVSGKSLLAFFGATRLFRSFQEPSCEEPPILLLVEPQELFQTPGPENSDILFMKLASTFHSVLFFQKLGRN